MRIFGYTIAIAKKEKPLPRLFFVLDDGKITSYGDHYIWRHGKQKPVSGDYLYDSKKQMLYVIYSTWYESSKSADFCGTNHFSVKRVAEFQL